MNNPIASTYMISSVIVFLTFAAIGIKEAHDTSQDHRRGSWLFVVLMLTFAIFGIAAIVFELLDEKQAIVDTDKALGDPHVRTIRLAPKR